jgi:hypothetical protein
MSLRGSNGGRGPKRKEGVTGGNQGLITLAESRRAGFADVAVYRSLPSSGNLGHPSATLCYGM